MGCHFNRWCVSLRYSTPQGRYLLWCVHQEELYDFIEKSSVAIQAVQKLRNIPGGRDGGFGNLLLGTGSCIPFRDDGCNGHSQSLAGYRFGDISICSCVQTAVSVAIHGVSG